ncbi:MAG: helix-turn-helix transcriptional regulator [Prevotella sp.]|nr:helix-turn-helix transcriptional regulator [Prevotella sp.]
MNTNDHLINDYSAVLDAKYGKEGTPERDKFNEEAYAFYTSQILTDARKEAKVSQTELAKRINTTRAYISKIENGTIDVSAGMFYRIMSALGLRIEIVRPLV